MNRIILALLLSSFLTACGSEEEQDIPIEIVDSTPPVILLNGLANVDHEQGTEYIDAGATATDDVDGTVEVVVTGEVGNAAGSYTLTFTATDAAGNVTSVTRTIVVQDTVAPTLTLIGDASISVELNSDYVEPGATATDSVDGDLDVTITGVVDTAIEGEYTITYGAMDAAGNATSAERTVTVIAPEEEEEESPTGDEIIVLDAGIAGERFDAGINAFDAAIDYAECNNDGGTACPSISWQVSQDETQGAVLEVTHASNAALAGLFVKTAQPLNLTDFTNGALLFKMKLMSGDSSFTMKLDCGYPCTSGNQVIATEITNEWQDIVVPLAELVEAGLDITTVDTGIVIWASSHSNTTFLLDDVQFSKTYEGESSLSGESGSGGGQTPDVSYTLTQFGKGSISDTINPASYRCVFDYGNWIYSAGVVSPGVAGCETATGTPVGEPTPLSPQVSGPAANKPLASHRWWGSVSFIGEMANGDPNGAGFITPDPIAARISNTGFRMLGIPAGLSVRGNDFGNLIPDPFAEVFDGIAIANSVHNNLEATAHDHSDGSVTVEWRSQNTVVMHATFVHGSPYVFLDVAAGDLVLKTLREDGGEKGTYFQNDTSLGLWTSVSGNTNHYLITGEGATTYTNATSNVITASNATGGFTIALMPSNNTTPTQASIDYFEQYARNVVAKVTIDYAVNNATQAVEISHSYLNAQNEAVETVVGQLPMHWKNVSGTTNYPYQVRSARGMTKFTNQSSFTYTLPFVGVLPTLPTFVDELDVVKLTALINEFVEQDQSEWNTYQDTYWSGKMYSKVSELVAIADAAGLTEQRDQLLTWLKGELEDWFNAERDDTLDTSKYFVYDETWDTLLGMEESFAAHQQLNDHHFHYGYFVRAAAEICRHDANWCDDSEYGGMVKLLIRDYAGDRDDALFPYLRHFDPANGFSWASGNVNFVRGNNNESTSEAANAYGAMVLFGLLTGDQDLTDRGIYLHASTTNAYWEYWNNIDGYLDTSADSNNFPAGYDRITTSIIWGDGAVFSTWFSGAFAHILGIQGLPTNPLTMHIGQYADYLVDYVELGLEESSNGQPSGLVADQWRDIWWNIWALTDATASIADYESAGDYEPEAGESKAHTFHWLHTMKQLGQLKSGSGEITANYPGAMVFQSATHTNYVAYNFGDADIVVTFSDGTEMTVVAGDFKVLSKE